MRAYPKGRIFKKPEEERIAEKILGIAVIGTTILASPVVGAAVFLIGVGASHYAFRKKDFYHEVWRLRKKNYIALTKSEKGWVIKILKKGRQRYDALQIQNLQLSPAQDWDHRWRLFIFDIPEKERYARDALRKKLKDLGLYNIQRSVFAYPHDCRKELYLVAGFYNLSRYCTYLETAYIDIDKELKQHFNLK